MGILQPQRFLFAVRVPAVTITSELVALIGIWGAMMAAMMLPSALPTFAVFHQVSRRHQPQLLGASLVYACGYALVWLVFSLAMAWTQWRMGQVALTASASWMTGALFLVAGAYQFSPLKQGCLRGCRSPFGFLLTDWKPGYTGAGWMGVRYGLHCLGCCWALMILMLGVGVMTLTGMVVITIMVTVEKLLPLNPVILTRINGALLLLWAGVLLVGPFEGF